MVRRAKSLDTVMELHESVHAYLLRLGRAYAVQIAQRDGDVDTRRVFAAMSQHEHASKILASMEGAEARHRWLGALMRSCRPQVWVWTGRRAERGSVERGTHSGGEGVKIWRLVAGADLTAFEAPDAVPPPIDTQALGACSGSAWGLTVDTNGLVIEPASPESTPTWHCVQPGQTPTAAWVESAKIAMETVARLRWRQREDPPSEEDVRRHMSEQAGIYVVIGEGANVVLTTASNVAKLVAQDTFRRSCAMPGWRWIALGSHGEIF